MDRIKVANIIEEGRYGGPQARIVRVAERLKTEGIDTLVICPDVDSERLCCEASRKQVEFRRLQLHRLTKNPSKIIRYIFTFPKEVLVIIRILKKENIDIVHCNSSRQFKGAVAGLLARKKVIWHVQDTWTPKIVRSIFHITAVFVPYFIAAGERVSKYYLRKFPLNTRQVETIQAPVDTVAFNPSNLVADPKIGNFPGLKIVTIGNVNPAKGIEYFIEMASRLNMEHQGLTFFVIGPHFKSQERYSLRMRRMAEDLRLSNLHFYGHCDDVAAALKASDIFVCSSVAEASPMVVWEAMSMAKPIVSSNVGDVDKFIKDCENGFVVPKRDAETLARKTSILIKNKELRDTFGIKAREQAIKYLDIERCARQHVDYYRAILNGRKKLYP
jgi:glycosyltransferase involved in cell wall biosynthesis